MLPHRYPPLWTLRLVFLVLVSLVSHLLGGSSAVALCMLGLLGAARAAPPVPAVLSRADDPSLWPLYALVLVVMVGLVVLGGPLASAVYLGAFAGSRILATADHPLLRMVGSLLSRGRRQRSG